MCAPAVRNRSRSANLKRLWLIVCARTACRSAKRPPTCARAWAIDPHRRHGPQGGVVAGTGKSPEGDADFSRCAGPGAGGGRAPSAAPFTRQTADPGPGRGPRLAVGLQRIRPTTGFLRLWRRTRTRRAIGPETGGRRAEPVRSGSGYGETARGALGYGEQFGGPRATAKPLGGARVGYPASPPNTENGLNVVP